MTSISDTPIKNPICARHKVDLKFLYLGVFPWTNLGNWLNLRLRQLSKAVYRGGNPEEIDNW
jgi:hypothetical protein